MPKRSNLRQPPSLSLCLSPSASCSLFRFRTLTPSPPLPLPPTSPSLQLFPLTILISLSLCPHSINRPSIAFGRPTAVPWGCVPVASGCMPPSPRMATMTFAGWTMTTLQVQVPITALSVLGLAVTPYSCASPSLPQHLFTAGLIFPSAVAITAQRKFTTFLERQKMQASALPHPLPTASLHSLSSQPLLTASLHKPQLPPPQ